MTLFVLQIRLASQGTLAKHVGQQRRVRKLAPAKWHPYCMNGEDTVLEHARIVVDANGAEDDAGTSLLRREAGGRRPQALAYRLQITI